MIEGTISPGDQFWWQPDPNDSGLRPWQKWKMVLTVVRQFHEGWMMQSSLFDTPCAMTDEELRRNSYKIPLETA